MSDNQLSPQEVNAAWLALLGIEPTKLSDVALMIDPSQYPQVIVRRWKQDEQGASYLCTEKVRVMTGPIVGNEVAEAEPKRTRGGGKSLAPSNA